MCLSVLDIIYVYIVYITFLEGLDHSSAVVLFHSKSVP